MNIKVAAYTVSEKSINTGTDSDTRASRDVMKFMHEVSFLNETLELKSCQGGPLTLC